MYIRSNMQPDLEKDYILETEDGKQYVGRWLVGRKYEGWYIKELPNNHYVRYIFSQKELPVRWFKLKDDESDRFHRYIPKAILDEAFCGHDEMPDFNLCPEINPYL